MNNCFAMTRAYRFVINNLNTYNYFCIFAETLLTVNTDKHNNMTNNFFIGSSLCL